MRALKQQGLPLALCSVPSIWLAWLCAEKVVIFLIARQTELGKTLKFFCVS